MRLVIFCLVASAVLPSLSRAQTPAGVPVFAFSKDESSMSFSVKASVALEGKFDKWDATMTFTSTDATAGVLDIKIQAASVDTGSGMKDGKLKSKDFFDSRAGSDDHISFQTRLCRPGLPWSLSNSQSVWIKLEFF